MWVCRSVFDLGFDFRASPPEPVHLTSVEPGGWAEVSGLAIGDELIHAPLSPEPRARGPKEGQAQFQNCLIKFRHFFNNFNHQS